MKFDDSYMLKLSVKLSDYENAKKYKSSKVDEDLIKVLFNYNTDKNIFNLFKKNKFINNPDLLLNLVANPFNNFEICEEYLNNNTIINKFFDINSSIITSLINSDSQKKIKLLSLLLENEKFDFNFKNENGLTNSQILSAENPTNIDTVFLEKVENLLKYKTEENKHLFYNLPKVSTEDHMKKLVSEPEDSYKINFADVELNLLKLNLKLRKMYEFDIIKLSNDDLNLPLNKLHIQIINNFLFEKLLLDKI